MCTGFTSSADPRRVALGGKQDAYIFFYSYGTAKSGVGISAMAVLRPDLMMKNVVPVVMAGIIAVRSLSAVPI